ncbi:MAG: hypothetical protein H6712_10705 [Myxococcales bacterium]|nr:hypothetical protein [Myxococcales bacterium]MCB9714319.1 hypothetical protein [Myxococcales bacterium]
MSAHATALAELDQHLDARLDSLRRRAEAGDALSFAAPGTAEDDELWELVRIANGDDTESLSFAAGEEGRLARARRELQELLERAVDSVTQLAVTDSRAGSSRAHTRVGWTGTITTHVDGGAPAALLRAHAAAVEGAVSRSLLRLELLTRIAVAAGRIARLLTNPGSAVMALPIAYRCVRDLYDRLRGDATPDDGSPWP